MGEFTLDTSGTVRRPGFARPLSWSDLSPFEQGYVEALFAEACDSRSQMVSAPKPRTRFRPLVKVGFSDLSPEALAMILKDCEGNAAFANTPEGGRMFWATRQRGAYAVNGGLRPLTVSLNDDGKVSLTTGGDQ